MNEISGSLARAVITAEAPAYATPSRRAVLHTGCASRALIALPAAMSLGIVLASPAQAQKAIPGQATGVNLNAGAYASYRSFTISSGSTISSAVTGVSGVYGANPANADTLANSGVVSATLASGVTLAAAGSTVSNAGTIQGGNAAGDYGVKISAGPSSIVNTGVITGYVGASANNGSAIYNAANAVISGTSTGARQSEITPGAAGAITNRGTIAESAGSAAPGGDAAVSMTGGYFHNTAGGVLLSNASGVYANTAPLTAVNAGIISAGPGETSFASYGILLAAGGTISNQTGGTIAGNTAGILITGTVVAVTNENGATIAGGGFGLYATAAGESISNAGVILQTATAASQVTGLGTSFSAIYLKNGGTFSNIATGVVQAAETGVRGGLTAMTIANAGLLSGLTTGVYIGPGGGTVINAAGGTISGGLAGVRYASTAGNFTNAGTILAASGNAIEFDAGGSITNLGTAQITGGAAGIQIAGGIGTVVNRGTIAATTGSGVLLAEGGTAANYGAISGGLFGIQAEGGASVSNSGTVTAATGTGILLSGNGTLTNFAGGVIAGRYGASLASGGALTNFGSITGSVDGIDAFDGGPITNAATASITGIDIGIAAFGAPLSVTNAGFIASGSGTAIALVAGGSVYNQTTGVITATAGPGIYIANAPGTITNAGQITASGFGVILKDGGFVSNSSGGIIASATVSGVYLRGASALNPDATLVNDGSITGGAIGVQARYGASIVNDIPGTIYGGTNAVFAEGAQISVSNGGLIAAGTAAGIDLAGGGTVSNLLTGTITGGTNGVFVAGGPGDVFNIGTISGGSGPAVLLEDGGEIVNHGVLISGGPVAIEINNTSGSLDNLSTITGSGTAVLFTAGGTIVNEPARLISGAAYGIHAYGGITNITNLGTIIATSGTGLAMAAGTVTNEYSGIIEGGAEGLSISGPGAVFNAGLIEDAGTAGAVIGSGVAVTNMPSGTITGTTGVEFTGTGSTMVNEGTIAGTSDAVSFSAAGVNFLTLSTGQTLIGTIDGGGSDSQIALDGIGTLTSTITNFGASSGLDIAPGANWTATGNWQIATVTNDGVFQPGIIGTPLSLAGNFVQNPDGTLQVIVTPAASSQLLVAGSAQLSGALSYNFAPGTYSPKTYAFLTSTGATIGVFSKITYNGAPANLLDATTYEPNATSLVLYAPGTPPPQSNPTPIIVEPEDDSIFSDEIQQSAINAQASNTALLDKASESAAAAGETAVCAAQASITPANTTPGDVSRTAMLANAVGNAFCGAGGWVQGSGSVFTTSGGSGPSYNANNGGFLAGIDKAIDDTGLRLGVAVGYDESNIKTGFGSKGTVDTIRAGVFASAPIGVFTIAADLMYGHADTTTTRLTGIGAAASKESGNIVSGGIQAETMLPIGAFSIMPSVGLRIAHVDAGAFAETAPGIEQAFAVRGAPGSYTSIQPYVNLDISTNFTGPGNITITPDVAAEYFYEAGNRGRAISLTAPDGTNFESAHVGLAGSAAALSAGISAGANNWAFYASYTAELGGNWTSQTGELGFRLRF